MRDRLADLKPTEVGDIGNYYGGLWVRCNDGKPEWCIEDYTGFSWGGCPEPVYRAILSAFGITGET